MGFKEYCIGVIKSAISREVLELAFYNREVNDSILSLDYKISSRALEPRFFLDLNLIAGVEVDIPLKDCLVVHRSETFTLVRIPDSILNGRKLINVLNLATSLDYENIYDANIESIAIKSFQKDVPMQSYITTRLEKLSNNEFLIGESFEDMGETMVKVLLSYSESFNEISSAFYPSLSLTALKAVELYIFTTLSIKIEKKSLYHGYELDIMRSTISSYQDSFKEYMELIDGKTKKQTFAADRVKMRRYMSMALGGYR